MVSRAGQGRLGRDLTLAQIEPTSSLEPAVISGTCRACGTALEHTFADLGVSPLANSYVPLAKAREGEMMFPLHAHVCATCFLVQLEEFEIARKHLFGLRLLFRLLDELAAARRGLCRRDGEALRIWERQPRSSKSQATTATCCSTSSSEASACLASSRRQTSPRSRSNAACRPGRLFRRRHGAPPTGRGPCRRPDRRQQRAGPCAGHPRFRGRLRVS